MSLVLPSVQAERGTESRDRHSDDARICQQAAIKTISDVLYTVTSLSLSHTHTHRQAAIKIADVLKCDPLSLTHTHARTHTHTHAHTRCD